MNQVLIEDPTCMFTPLSYTTFAFTNMCKKGTWQCKFCFMFDGSVDTKHNGWMHWTVHSLHIPAILICGFSFSLVQVLHCHRAECRWRDHWEHDPHRWEWNFSAKSNSGTGAWQCYWDHPRDSGTARRSERDWATFAGAPSNLHGHLRAGRRAGPQDKWHWSQCQSCKFLHEGGCQAISNRQAPSKKQKKMCMHMHYLALNHCTHLGSCYLGQIRKALTCTDRNTCKIKQPNQFFPSDLQFWTTEVNNQLCWLYSAR